MAVETTNAKITAPGAPELAASIQNHISITPIRLDDTWGLDHGTWSILTRLYPQADIPVIQMSLDTHLSPEKHWALGQELSFLREEGVLILGSGNIVHHLGLIRWGGAPYSWATAFDATIKQCLQTQQTATLLSYRHLEHADLAAPTNEHFLPLLYAYGASRGETPQFFNESIFASSLSMTSVLFG